MGLIPAQFSLLVTIAKPRSSLPEMKDLDSCSADLSRICDVSEEGGKQPFPDPCCMDTTRHVLAPNVWPPPFLPFAFFLTVHCLSFSLVYFFASYFINFHSRFLPINLKICMSQFCGYDSSYYILKHTNMILLLFILLLLPTIFSLKPIVTLIIVK